MLPASSPPSSYDKIKCYSEMLPASSYSLYNDNSDESLQVPLTKWRSSFRPERKNLQKIEEIRTRYSGDPSLDKS
eukprot:UN34162